MRFESIVWACSGGGRVFRDLCVCVQMYYVCALVYSSDIETVSDELAGRVSPAQQDLKARNREQWLVLVEICHEGLLLFQRLRRWFPRSFGVMSLCYFPHAHCYNSQVCSVCFGRQQSSTYKHTHLAPVATTNTVEMTCLFGGESGGIWQVHRGRTTLRERVVHLCINVLTGLSAFMCGSSRFCSVWVCCRHRLQTGRAGYSNVLVCRVSTASLVLFSWNTAECITGHLFAAFKKKKIQKRHVKILPFI